MTHTNGHDFGWALEQLREKRRVYRHGWNGMGMKYIYLQKRAIRLIPTL
jgi:hypothetical protein